MNKAVRLLEDLEHGLDWFRTSFRYRFPKVFNKKDWIRIAEFYSFLYNYELEIPKEKEGEKRRVVLCFELMYSSARKITSALVLLESGFPEEALQIARSSIEFSLLMLCVGLRDNDWRKWTEWKEGSFEGDRYFSHGEMRSRLLETLDPSCSGVVAGKSEKDFYGGLSECVHPSPGTLEEARRRKRIFALQDWTFNDSVRRLEGIARILLAVAGGCHLMSQLYLSFLDGRRDFLKATGRGKEE